MTRRSQTTPPLRCFQVWQSALQKIDGVVAFALLLSDEQMVGLIKHRRREPKRLCEFEGFVLLDGVVAFTNWDGASVALPPDGVLDRVRRRYQYKQVGSRPRTQAEPLGTRWAAVSSWTMPAEHAVVSLTKIKVTPWFRLWMPLDFRD